jgi:hypothetical protein
VLSYTRWIHEDPLRPGLIYLGTEASLYASFDDGATWTSLNTNLPHTPMYGIVVQEHFNDLVVGTYGRGFWILDDITPLQQMDDSITSASAHLFDPRAAYRFRPVSEQFAMFDDQSDGQDPEFGASINYWVGEGVEEEAEIEISNAEGDVVRTLTDSTTFGVNRVWWDLQGEQIREVNLRTKPLYADDIDLGEERTRPFTGGRPSVLQPPGTYTVTLRVGDETFTAPLEVRKDPNSEGSLADIDAQVASLEDMWSDADSAAALVNRIESVRRQVLDTRDLLADRGEHEELVEAADSLDRALIAVEEGLFQMRTTGEGQDQIRYPSRLMERLAYLFNTTAVADFRPTDQAGEVQVLLKERLAAIAAALEAVLNDDLEEFNQQIQSLGLRIIT